MICKDFLEQGGLKLLLQVTDLPCLPVRFIDLTDIAHALSHLFRTIGENDHVKLVNQMIESITSAMDACRPLWHGPSPHSQWLSLENGGADEFLREQLGRLKGLSTRISNLSEMLIGQPWSHARPTTNLFQALGMATGSEFIFDFALLHRNCFFEHAALSSSSPPHSPTSAAPSTLIGTEEPNVATNTKAMQRESGVRFMARRMHAVLAKFFKCECTLPGAAHSQLL